MTDLLDAFDRVFGPRDNQPRVCPTHLTPGWCEMCAARIDAAADRADDTLSEGDMRALDERYERWLEREAS